MENLIYKEMQLIHPNTDSSFVCERMKDFFNNESDSDCKRRLSNQINSSLSDRYDFYLQAWEDFSTGNWIVSFLDPNEGYESFWLIYENENDGVKDFALAGMKAVESAIIEYFEVDYKDLIVSPRNLDEKLFKVFNQIWDKV
jgi:hypothetical protein